MASRQVARKARELPRKAEAEAPKEPAGDDTQKATELAAARSLPEVNPSG